MDEGGNRAVGIEKCRGDQVIVAGGELSGIIGIYSTGKMLYMHKSSEDVFFFLNLMIDINSHC